MTGIVGQHRRNIHFEVAFGNLQAFINTFFNRNRRNNNNEFGEPVEPVHFHNRAQVNVGFARTCFHFYRKIIVL